MSKKGGYQIVSLKQPVDVSKLELSSGKVVLLTDINIGGVEKKDVFAQVEKVVAEEVITYVIKGVYGYELTIDADGEITWNEQKFGTSLYKHSLTITSSSISITGDATLKFISAEKEKIQDISHINTKLIAFQKSTYGTGMECIPILVTPTSTNSGRIISINSDIEKIDWMGCAVTENSDVVTPL